MSIFVKSLKTFRSNITGEEREYKINNAIWAFLESEYNLKPSDLSAESTSDVEVAKFVHAVFHANGLSTTLEEILENTAGYDTFEFMTEFNLVNNENFTLATERLTKKTNQKKKQTTHS